MNVDKRSVPIPAFIEVCMLIGAKVLCIDIAEVPEGTTGPGLVNGVEDELLGDAGGVTSDRIVKFRDIFTSYVFLLPLLIVIKRADFKIYYL